MRKNTKRNIAALLAFMIGGTAYGISGMVTTAGEMGQDSQPAEGEGYISSEDPGEAGSSQSNESVQDPESAENQGETEQESVESSADNDGGNIDRNDSEATQESEENADSGSGESPDRTDSDQEKDEAEETADTEVSVMESETQDTGEIKEENPESGISQGTEEDQEKQEESAGTEPGQKTEGMEGELPEGELPEDNGAPGKDGESSAEEKEIGSLEGFGTDMESPEMGSVPQDAAGEFPEEAQAGLQMPKQLTVTIDPWEIEERGQVYSEPYLIQNSGDAPIQVVLRETIYSLRENETFICTDAEGLHEREEKSIYVQMNFDNGDQFILTEEGVEYGMILEPGTGLQFWFSGEVNENAVQLWGDGEVRIEITYSWSTEEIMAGEAPENIGLLPDEPGNVKENTDMEGAAGTGPEAADTLGMETGETEEAEQNPDEEGAEDIVDGASDEGDDESTNGGENKEENEKESSESEDINGEKVRTERKRQDYNNGLKKV